MVSIQPVASPQNRCYYFISGEIEARQGVDRIGNLPKIPQLSDKIRIQTWHVSFQFGEYNKQTKKQINRQVKSVVGHTHNLSAQEAEIQV